MIHCKTIVKTTLALALTTLALNAECKIFTSPATDFSTLKGSDSLSLSISNIYYEKDKKGKKKMKFKSGSEAFLEFDGKAKAFIQGECAKYNLTIIYNYRIGSTIDEHRYNFYATYDYK